MPLAASQTRHTTNAIFKFAHTMLGDNVKLEHVVLYTEKSLFNVTLLLTGGCESKLNH